MNICAECNATAKAESGICTIKKGHDGLPVLCVGPWAVNKHYFLNRFCEIFAVGMKHKWPNRWFIDLFSGPGLSINNQTGKEIEGSPLIALSHLFTHFVFAESNENCMDALRQRVEAKAVGGSVKYVSSDVNDQIDKVFSETSKRKSIYLAFGDPFNIQLKMSTLETLSAQRRLDLLLHFPYGTYLRRVLSQKSLSEETLKQVDDFFGSKAWRLDLFKKRDFAVGSLLSYYEQQLKRFGYELGNNFPIMKNSREADLYCLIFASRNPRGLDFWHKACEIEPSGQRKLF